MAPSGGGNVPQRFRQQPSSNTQHPTTSKTTEKHWEDLLDRRRRCKECENMALTAGNVKEGALGGGGSAISSRGGGGASSCSCSTRCLRGDLATGTGSSILGAIGDLLTGTPRLDIGVGSVSSVGWTASMTETTDSDFLDLLLSVSLTGVLASLCSLRSSRLCPGDSASILASSIICFKFISKFASS